MPDKKTRQRRFKFDASKLVERALKFVFDDEMSRAKEIDHRLQLYAKYRQWTTDDVEFPFEDASDVALPDLATASLRVQDTLYNAVMRTRPAMNAKSTVKGNREKEEVIDDLIDYQAFVENAQTDWLGDIVDAFVNDGHYTLFIPWIEEQDKIVDRRVAPPIPEEPDENGNVIEPDEYFRTLMADAFPEASEIVPAKGGTGLWDWIVMFENEPPVDVSFYTSAKGVEMDITRIVPRFQGPALIPKDREDVLHPVNAANLQPPSPFNPLGASHVVLRDTATVMEIRRLQKTGFYDGLTAKDVKEKVDEKGKKTGESELKGGRVTNKPAMRGQIDAIQGDEDQLTRGPEEHEPITRLMVFDRIVLDSAGFVEDVVYWVAMEPKKLLRKPRRLSEQFPSSFVVRPFAEAQFIPVRGRRTGIGLLELGEGAHDTNKQLMDMAFNLTTFQMQPPGFYRPTSSLKEEVIRYLPSELIPLSDPKNDINFPIIPNQGFADGVNLMTINKESFEKVTGVGDLEMGRVPKGKSAALRTVGGISMIQAQGDARPERLLHRFFSGLAQAWRIMHEYNKRLLPPSKMVRVASPSNDQENPYREIDRNDLDGIYDFEFKANIFNTSRVALQETLTQLAQFYISGIAFETGVSDPGTVYTLIKKITEAFGQDADELGLKSPLGMPMVTFEEALEAIMDDVMPTGSPAEGPVLHMQKMELFALSENFELLEPQQVELFEQWSQVVQGFVMELMQQQQMARAAGGQGQTQQGGQDVRPGERSENPQVQANELLDESLPSSGGGANVEGA